MDRFGRGKRFVPRIHFVFAMLLAVLLVFGTTASATHYHADGLVHADCVICHSAPHAIEISTALATQQSPVPTRRVVLWAEPLCREHIFSFDHWNKPPPVGTVAAAQS